MARSTSAASLSLAVGGRDGFTVGAPPQAVRNLVLAGAAVVSGLVFLVRRAPGDAVRRRVVRRLDRIAPRRKFDQRKMGKDEVINTDCKFLQYTRANMVREPNRRHERLI